MFSDHFNIICNGCKFNSSCCDGYGKSPCCYCDRVRRCPEQNQKRDNYVKVEVDENDKYWNYNCKPKNIGNDR